MRGCGGSSTELGLRLKLQNWTAWAYTLALHLLLASEKPNLNATCEPGASILTQASVYSSTKWKEWWDLPQRSVRVLNEPISTKHLAPKPLNENKLSL